MANRYTYQYRRQLVLLASWPPASFSTHRMMLERASALLRCPLQRSAAGSSAAGRTDNSPDFARGGWSRNREEPLEKRSKLTPFVQV